MVTFCLQLRHDFILCSEVLFCIVSLHLTLCVGSSALCSCNDSSRSPCSFFSCCSAPAASFNNLYFLLLFFAALSAFFFFTSPTIDDLLCSPWSRSSTFWANSSRASLRFWLRDRVACDLTTMPVGICFNWTAEFVLFYVKPCISQHQVACDIVIALMGL